MKEKIKQIYREVSIGALSQNEALNKIRKLKLGEPDNGDSLLFASPAWKRLQENPHENYSVSAVGRQYVLVCDMPQVDGDRLARISKDIECISIITKNEEAVAHRYLKLAHICFDVVHGILSKHPQKPVLIQILI
ncbi:MAG: hypothetical protein GF344_12530, partial [Chitinivibrionales bacterium]|nr:hypothetical protein [Chitinivibrionales bacterium]